MASMLHAPGLNASIIRDCARPGLLTIKSAGQRFTLQAGGVAVVPSGLERMVRDTVRSTTGPRAPQATEPDQAGRP